MSDVNCIPDQINKSNRSVLVCIHVGLGSYSPLASDLCIIHSSTNLRFAAIFLHSSEPQSGFHFDPIIVCDFTALYPSLIIAYNLCYSSCAGKLDYHSTRKEMRREGQTTSRLGPFHYDERRTATVLKHHMKSLSSANNVGNRVRDRAYVIPTGSLFVSETVVKGVLPQVLDEILATRAMLKRAAKTYKKHVPNVAPSILRSLEAKQLALKYVANVTYGTFLYLLRSQRQMN